jgi:hypothetical protein
VGGGEALAEAAAVKDFHVVVAHSPGPCVPGLVDLQRLGVPLLDGVGVSYERDLDLLDEGHLRLVQALEDFPHYVEAVEALLVGLLAQPHLDVVALVEVHEALDEVGVLMHPPLDNALQVFLDLLAGDLDDETEGSVLPLFQLREILPYDCDLAVLDLVHAPGLDQFELVLLSGAAQLHLHVPAPDPLALVDDTYIHGDILEHRHLTLPPLM